MPYTFHVVGLPHTVTSKEYLSCAYSQKILNFCEMMTSLGDKVYHYGNVGSTVNAIQQDIWDNDQRIAYFGEYDWKHLNFKINWDPNELYWKHFNSRVIRLLKLNIKPKDFICIIGGSVQKEIADAFPDNMSVEYGIGYYGIFAKYKVFESYTHQAACYAMNSKDPDGSFYDTVIPNYFDIKDFPYSTKHTKGENLLYLGRIIQRKGILTAIEVAKYSDSKLIVAGQGISHSDDLNYYSEDGLTLPKSIVEYVGYADVEKRRKLMQEAFALILPTQYIEPFGGVVIEANLCGTPVITTDYGAFSSTVINGFNGFRCSTLKDFLQAIEWIPEVANDFDIMCEAQNKYCLQVIRYKYQDYFNRLYDLWGDGWYTR